MPEPRGARGGAGGLSAALGRTRTEVLLALTEPRTTTDLARRTGISNATASAHATALRAAGLITRPEQADRSTTNAPPWGHCCRQAAPTGGRPRGRGHGGRRTAPGPVGDAGDQYGYDTA
ncbi:winged helix-turn-helix domain-containing protein [Streptomyces zaomyceticus]|uniref:winged helix-turn-helix domain-containing protein n=1 Tax=Streptomyces zaomyceticus TaxID=68286 RepID=UPI00339F3293